MILDCRKHSEYFQLHLFIIMKIVQMLIRGSHKSGQRISTPEETTEIELRSYGGEPSGLHTC